MYLPMPVWTIKAALGAADLASAHSAPLRGAEVTRPMFDESAGDALAKTAKGPDNRRTSARG